MSEVWTKWQGYVVNGEYPLLRYLGGSDQSAVFLSEAAGRQPTEVAIKLVPAHPTFAELLLARWKAASELPHPNLVQLLDGGQIELGGQPFAYVVMEYADQQLAELLEHRALTEGEACEMLLPVLDALGFLHNRNLVQGQLKPANVLVVGDQVRLASDTIRPVSDAFASTNIASVYDPPEVQDGSLSTAGDIWALGVTLFEALTRTAPLGLENGRAGAALPAELSGAIREIVSWCLKRRPFDRPKVAELEAKIREVGAAAAAGGERAGVEDSPGAGQVRSHGVSQADEQAALGGASVALAGAQDTALRTAEIVVNPDSFAFVDAPTSGGSGEVHAQFSAADELVGVTQGAIGATALRPASAASPTPAAVSVARAELPAAPVRSPGAASGVSAATAAPISTGKSGAGGVPPARTGSTSSAETVPVLKVGAAGAATPGAGGTSSPGTAPGMKVAPATGAVATTGSVPVMRVVPGAKEPTPVAKIASAAAGGAEAKSTSSTGTMPVMRAPSVPGGAPGRVGSAAAAGAVARAAQPASETARAARSATAVGRAATVLPPAAGASSTIVHPATTAPSQQTRPTPPSAIDIATRIAREAPTPRATGPQVAGAQPPALAVISKTIELKKPTLEEAPSDALPDFPDEEIPRRPPYVLLLVAICVLIVGWVVVQGLGATPQQTPVAAQPAPPRRPVESEPTTLVREVPKSLVIATAPDTTPPQQQQEQPKRQGQQQEQQRKREQQAELVSSTSAAAPVELAGIHQEIPEVPSRARRTIRGHVKVTVRLIVDKDGAVFAALVDNPGPSRYFERIAIDAAKRWTFPPVDGTDSRLELVQFDFTSQGATGAAVAVQ